MNSLFFLTSHRNIYIVVSTKVDTPRGHSQKGVIEMINDIKKNCTNGLCENECLDTCLSCISNQNEFGWETIELDQIENLKNKYL